MTIPNYDKKTGCHYGVIAINSLHEFIWDELEAYYGDPTCPNCGRDNLSDSSGNKDYHCENCEQSFWSDECLADEALGHTLDDGVYKAETAFNQTCLFLMNSPYYTYVGPCSPCAPNAGDLDNPRTGEGYGLKTLCFGHEMFEGDKAPYTVFKLADGSQVDPK